MTLAGKLVLIVKKEYETFVSTDYVCIICNYSHIEITSQVQH